ncbi:holo-ACP synthase [Candidatus Bipolaricaulota bacterium]|nr:holo-ACP synthase [Candidatus Bipolaricaulota bacterium]
MSGIGIGGIGIDLVKVPRIKRLADKWGRKFLERVFTKAERDYCLSGRRQYEHLAGRFAAKEAVIKALGIKIPWKSIKVESDRNGRPFVLVESDNEKTIFSTGDLHVSITHLEYYAIAIAVVED